MKGERTDLLKGVPGTRLTVFGDLVEVRETLTGGPGAAGNRIRPAPGSARVWLVEGGLCASPRQGPPGLAMEHLKTLPISQEG